MSGVICPHCGKVHREGAKFCATTGKMIPTGIQPPGGVVPTPSGPQPQRPASPTVADIYPAHLQAGLTGRLPPNSFLRNRYLILRKIGQGGMAAVYQATDTIQPGSQWAIKEMSDAALSASDRDYAVQTFLQEGNLLRTLNHPNLPRVIDVFSESGKHYLVMEFVPGQTLQNMIEDRTQPFSQTEVLTWALQLCDVLSYLHNQNPKIIFRDLKPSNIMLTPQGQIKLIDFGIVRFFKPGKTRDTMALGTPGYAAQEAIAGQTDERSDLYSLCVTLHQLLTLNDPAQTMFHHPPARQLNPLISEELNSILECGLKNQRELRWSSAEEMHTVLTQLVQQHGIPYGGKVSAAFVTPNQAVGANMAASSWEQKPDWQTSPPARQQMPTVVDPQSGAPYPPGAQYPPPPSYQPPSQYPPAYPSGAGAGIKPSLGTSRPTTRLIIAAAQFSGRQLAAMAIGTVFFLVLAVVLLAEPMAEMNYDWNNIPIIAIFGALGYTAYPKRGTAFVSHALLSAILTATVWLRLGDQGYTWLNLGLATLLSGVFVELWVLLLPKVKGDRGDEGWRIEAVWMAGMALIAALLFMGLATGWITGWKPVQLVLSALLGLGGWFLGDMLKQYLLYRKTGLRKL